MTREQALTELRAIDRRCRACGADVNDLIAGFPFDGQEREAACLGCGLAISFRSPLFELEATP